MALLAWIFGFIPGLLWLWFVYKKDKYEPEPVAMVLFVFAAGALSVIPAAMIESLFSGAMDIRSVESVNDAARVSWLVAGLVEESMKFAVVMLIVWKRKGFDEPMDGIVYAAAAALGFASAENVIYIYRFGAQVIIVRGVMSTLGHLLFSSIWGYAIGRAKFDRKKRFSLLAKGFVLAAFFHGLYDFLVFTKVAASFGLYVLTVVLWNMLARMMKDAEAKSPFKPKKKSRFSKFRM